MTQAESEGGKVQPGHTSQRHLDATQHRISKTKPKGPVVATGEVVPLDRPEAKQTTTPRESGQLG